MQLPLRFPLSVETCGGHDYNSELHRLGDIDHGLLPAWLSFPLCVTVEPRLRSQIEQRESLNGKVAFSIRCEMNGTISYMNRSAGMSCPTPCSVG